MERDEMDLIKQRLSDKYDEVGLVELLGITVEDLLDAFEYKIMLLDEEELDD